MRQGDASQHRWLKAEEANLKHKVDNRWLEKGNGNRKYFHILISERKIRLSVHRIMNQEGQWITKDQKQLLTPIFFVKDDH